MSTHLTIDLNLNILAAYLVYSCIFQQDDQLSLSLFTRYILHICICIFIWHGMVSHLPICCIDLCN